VPLAAAAARRLGLPTGVPVAGPYIDQEAGYLAAVGVSRNPLQCSLGTAWVGNFVLPEGCRGFAPIQLVIPSPASLGRLVILPLLTGNVFWEWGLSQLMDWRADEALAQAKHVLAKPSAIAPGLVALPWLMQANPDDADVVGAGGFLGVGPDTDRADMFRALAASLAFELARVFAAVRASGILDGIVLGGGASQTRFFRALISTLFQPLPVYYAAGETSAAARGALHVFATKATTVRVRRVRGPSRQEDILRAYAHYKRAFANHGGSLPAAAAYTMRRSKK
jgi:sugar (pentulose or hexulose) kinase